MTVTSSSSSSSSAASAPVPGTSVPPQTAPMGKPVSGRTWKKAEKARFSTVRYKGTKVLSSSWDEKVLKRAKLKEMKALQAEIKSRRQGERDAKRQAREDKEKRRKENELKSASVQVISRTHRMKTMSKKQLRNVRKTIVNKQGVVEYVPIYGSNFQVSLAPVNAAISIFIAALAPTPTTPKQQPANQPANNGPRHESPRYRQCVREQRTVAGPWRQRTSPKALWTHYNSRIGSDWAEESKKCKSAEEIKLDMETLAKVTSIVRLYSLADCNQGAVVIPAPLNAGMNVSVGLWVSKDDAVFQVEKKKLEELIKPERGIFRSDRIFDIHVGSDAIYREEITAAKNIEYLKEIKAICKANANAAEIPVTIADIGDTYLAHPELIDEVDIVSANGFPFWEKTDIKVAAEHFRVHMTPLFNLAKTKKKEVFISETGWASGGASTESSEASPANALKYLKDFYTMATANGWKYFYFAAFDEDWKIAKGSAAEKDTVEGHFGLYYANRTLKEIFQTMSVTESLQEASPVVTAATTGGATTTTTTSNGSTAATDATMSTSAAANANGKDKCTT